MFKRYALAVVVFCTPICANCYGQEDEQAIRSSELGIYQSPSWGDGSITGFDDDIIVFRDSTGATIETPRPIKDWRQLPPIPGKGWPFSAIYQTTGGKWTLRFNYDILCRNFLPALPGGTVELKRNGQLIDRDRIVSR